MDRRIHEASVIPRLVRICVSARYDCRMEISSEQNARRILAAGILFATIGILALVITLMQPGVKDERERLADDIFSQPTVQEKADVLATLSASSTGAGISEEEKLRVLESLRTQ